MTPSRPLSPESTEQRRVLRLTPIRLGVVAVLAIAAVALVLLLVPRRDIAPIGGASPAASATAQPTPTLEPSASLTPSPTLAATPVPTPARPAVWTGLTWSDPVTPSFTVHLNDVVPWGAGYVAVGMVETESGPAARILASPDGLNWTVAFDPGEDHWPQHLAVLGDELLAFSQRIRPLLPPDQVVGAPPDTFIWRSTDGEHWSQPESWPTLSSWFGPLPAGWDESQYPIVPGLVDVASGADGLVAIGNSRLMDGSMAPFIQHSTDGRSWTVAALPAESDSALLNAIVEFDGRFVITGAVGIGPDPAEATATAWYSDDGLTWVRATVEPDEFLSTAGAEFGRVVAGADGLLAWAGAREMHTGPRFTTVWTSPDGLAWSPAETPFSLFDRVSSDGARIVALGPMPNLASDPALWPGISAGWVSTDGSTWTPLEQSRVVDDWFEAMWVVPDGVIYAGTQSFWFGAAQVAE